MWWQVIVGVLTGLAVLWLLLLAVLWRSRSDGLAAKDAVRLLPDVLRLLARLARDKELPVTVRWRLWLTLGYLASPVDLVPDVIPVLGYADDVIVVVLVLRSVVRRAGTPLLERHWPGSPEGLAALKTLAGLTDARA